jgi:hypothetical protein
MSNRVTMKMRSFLNLLSASLLVLLASQTAFAQAHGTSSSAAGDVSVQRAMNLLATFAVVSPPYNASCDGSTNDAAAIQAAINAAAAVGGGRVQFPSGKACAISSTLTINSNYIGFYCPTISITPETGYVVAPSCGLKWTGIPGGTILSIIAPTGRNSDLTLHGNFLIGMFFDGNDGLAGNGVVLESVRNGYYFGDTFAHFNGGYDLDVNVVHATSSTFSPTCDSQGNLFNSISFDQNRYTSVGIRLGAYSSSSLSCNASENTFINTIGTISGNDGVDFEGADNNVFEGVTDIYRQSGGIGSSLKFKIRTDGTLTYPANTNLIFKLTSPSAPYAVGRTSNPSCTAYNGTATNGSCTFGNRIVFLDESNATPFPIVEPGAQLSFSTSDGKSLNYGPAPTLGSCTGLGTSGTCAFAANSQNGVGIIVLTISGTGSGTSGVIPVTYSYPPGSSGGGTACTVQLMSNSAEWPATSVAVLAAVATNAGFTVRWATNSAALVAGTYNVIYRCMGY